MYFPIFADNIWSYLGVTALVGINRLVGAFIATGKTKQQPTKRPVVFPQNKAIQAASIKVSQIASAAITGDHS